MDNGWVFLKTLYKQIHLYQDIPMEAYLEFFPLEDRSIHEQKLINKIFRSLSRKYPSLLEYLIEEHKHFYDLGLMNEE